MKKIWYSMQNNSGLLLSICLLWTGMALTAQQKTSFYPINPIRFTEITDSFWKERMEANREVTIPIAFQRSEESGRIKNFRVAAGIEEGTYNTGRGYDDSDMYKVRKVPPIPLANIRIPNWRSIWTV